MVEDVPLPCILHWNQNHFVVCYNIKKLTRGYKIYIADPASQLITYSEQEFKKCWLATKENSEDKGTALVLEPGPEFYNQKDEKQEGMRGLLFFVKYFVFICCFSFLFYKLLVSFPECINLISERKRIKTKIIY